MSNTESIRLPRAAERRSGASGHTARLSPFVEKALLFWGLSAVAGCWMAVVWWIVR